MPTHGYTVNGHPPTVLDHLLAHCFELLICAWAILGGAASIFAAFGTVGSVSPALDLLNPIAAGIVGVLLLLGGLLVWRGIFDDSDNLMTGWRYERVGLVFSAVAWASYAVTIFSSNSAAVLTITLCLFLAAACGLRYAATVVSERRTRKQIR